MCGVHADLCWSLSTLLVLFVVPLFVVLTFFFQPPRTWLFWKIKQNAYEHIHPRYSMWCLLWKTQGARDSLYSIGLLPSSHSGIDASAGHVALRDLPLRSVITYQNTTAPTTTITTTPPPPAYYCCHTEKSIVISQDDYNTVTKFQNFNFLTKR